MRHYCCLVVMLFMATGCGEIAYKQGASAKDYEATKKSCKSAGDDAAVEKCLEDKGWAVQNLGTIGLPDSELFATATVSDDNRNPVSALKDAKKNKPLENSAISEATPTLDVTKLADTQDINPTSDKPLTAKPQTAQTSAPSSAPPQTPAKPTVNPFEQYKINSWWKMGAGREALEASMAACANTLGDAHQPDRKTQTFTRAFAACMYDKGWRGLREK